MAAQPASVGTDTSEAPAEPAYMLVDVTAERAVCEWWFVDTVAAPSSVQTFGAAFEVRHGSSRLAPSAQTAARTGPPPWRHERVGAARRGPCHAAPESA